MKTLLPILALSLLASSAYAQRANTPPGMSQDGSRPADGAIKGGSPILPGESGGLPNKEQAKEQRCYELSGSLREDCLKKEESNAAAGGTMPSTPRRPTDILKK